MGIEEELRGRLVGFPGLGALVGERVHPLRLPPGVVLPALTYQRVSGPRYSALAGPSFLPHPRFQFTAWAQGYLQARDVRQQVRRALEEWVPSTGGGTRFLNELDLVEGELGWYQCIVDFEIWH